MKKIIKIFLCLLFLISIAACSSSKENVTIVVKFDSDNGKEITTVNVKKDQTVAKPTDPTKEGYIFDCWTLNNVEYDFAQPVSQDITLKANYIKTHTVIFKVDGDVISSLIVKDKDTVTSQTSLPTAPDKEGYEFKGWQLNGIDFDVETKVESDLELIANYTKLNSTKTTTIHAESVSLNKNSIDLYINEKAKLTATVKPDDTNNKTVTFTSSDKNIASVDNDGNVLANNPGKATITAKTENGKTATCVINVKAIIHAESVTLNKNNIDLYINEKAKLTATVKPDDTNNKTVTFTSSDKNIASVDNDGNVLANNPGKATITAKTENGKTTTCVINVKAIEVTGVQLDKKEFKVARGNSTKLTATVAPTNATNKNVSFTSSHPEVATVDANGNVTGVSKGTTTIIATTDNGKTTTCDVEVFVKVESITISYDRNTIAYDGNKTANFTVVVTPSDADYSIISWNTTGNVGGQNGAYSFETTGTKNNAAVLTARELSKYNKSCDIYAYITNVDGTTTKSNTISIKAEETLTVSARTGTSNWHKQNDIYYATCANNANLEIVANLDITATLNTDEFVNQEYYDAKEVWLTLVNTRDHAEGFVISLVTPGGQSAKVSVTVNKAQ